MDLVAAEEYLYWYYMHNYIKIGHKSVKQQKNTELCLYRNSVGFADGNHTNTIDH